MAVEDDAVSEAGSEEVPEEVTHPSDLDHRTEIRGKVAGGAQRRDEERALCAGSPSGLMARAVDKRLEADAAADVQGAHALRRVELVARDRQEVDAELVDPGHDLADRLCGVGVEQDAAFAGDRAHSLDRLDRPDLVVRVDDANEDRPGCDRPADVIGVDATAAIWIEVRHARAEALEEARRLEDRGMLDRGR